MIVKNRIFVLVLISPIMISLILSSCGDSFTDQMKEEYNSRTPPAVIAITPASGETGVDINSPITVKFNIPVNPASVTPSSFIVKDNTNSIIDGYITASGETIKFTHNNPFRVLRNYTVTVTSSVTNMGGIPMIGNVSSTFTVGHRFDEALELYLPFNGNSLDESGNEYDGIQYGGPTLAADRFGNPDNAYYFDGVDDYIEMMNGIYLKPEIITISIWVQNDDPTRSKSIPVISKPRGITQYTIGFQCFNGNTNVRSMIYPDSSPSLPSEYGVSHYSTTTGWIHRVVTYDNSIIRYYINGVQNNSFEINGSFNWSDRPWIIGWLDYFEYGYYRGRLDDIRIYSRALGADEIEALYHEGGWDE